MVKKIQLGIVAFYLLFVMAASINLSRWMEELPNQADVRRIIIPGTHDSGTYNLSIVFSKCQDFSIT